MLSIPKIIIIVFTTFDSQCFCSLTWLSINALLTYIVFYFFSILLSDKEIIFCYRLLKENDLISQTKKRESKWKYTTQMKSIAFTFIVYFFLPFYIRHWFHYLQLHNLISHDVLNGTFLMKHKYFYITVNKHLLNCILTSIWYWY